MNRLIVILKAVRLGWRFVQAYMRWSKKAVCELSTDERDFHDYPDDITNSPPLHGCEFRCRRCGKQFEI